MSRSESSTSSANSNTSNTKSAFQRHLTFFASPHQSNKITLLSGLKSSLSLGLNFPVSVLLSIGLRILYSPSLIIPIRRPDPSCLRRSQRRSMLEQTSPSTTNTTKNTFSRADLLSLLPRGDSTLLNRMHINGLWALSADRNGMVSRDDIESLKRGDLVYNLAERRKWGRGKDTVVPFLRGGPGNVAGHSWVVGRMFGVDVYLNENEKGHEGNKGRKDE